MKVPFTNIGPVSLLLSFIEIDIEADDELFEETLSQQTGFKFCSSPSSFVLEIFFFPDLSSNSS
jgi:hypothetical protein